MGNETPWRLAIYSGSPVTACVRVGNTAPEPLVATTLERVIAEASSLTPDTAPQEVLLIYPPWLQASEIAEWIAELGRRGVDNHSVRTVVATDVLAPVMPPNFVLVDAPTGRAVTRFGRSAPTGDKLAEQVDSLLAESDAFTTPVVVLGDLATGNLVAQELSHTSAAMERYSYTELVSIALASEQLQRKQGGGGQAINWYRFVTIGVMLVALLIIWTSAF